MLLALLLGQLSSGGAAVSVAPPSGTAPVRWPDVAYGSADDVFLAVSGAGALQGQYFSSTGAAEGTAFVVNAGAVFGQAPRVTYSPGLDAFLVTWHESIGNDTRIRGRLIRHGNAALTGDLDLSPFGTNWEMGAAVAWASTSQVFLLAWQDRATTQIHAQRLSSTGAMLGSVITVEGAPYERDPSVAYDPATDRFLVAYAGCVGTDDCFVHAQRLEAGTGAKVGTALVLEPSVRAGYVPEVAYNAFTADFLVVWFRNATAGTGLYAKTISAGGVVGALEPVSAVASYDANSVAWNPVSNTFVVVTHSSGAQDLAIELGASGRALSGTVLFGDAAASGNFNPRVASSTRDATWLGVTSNAFAMLSAQRLSSLTRDDTGRPVDAGVPDAGVVDAGAPDAGTDDGGAPLPDAGSDAGVVSDAGSASPDGGPGSIVGTGSCGCTSSNTPLVLAFVLMIWLRRGRVRVVDGAGRALTGRRPWE